MNKQKKSIVTGVLFMAITLILFLPGVSFPGSLEPMLDAVDTSGNPVSTMKTLDEIPPVWSQKLRADDGNADGCNSSRFKCVLDGAAVLDKETGLVWERAPFYTEPEGFIDWYGAQWSCNAANTGGRFGWRVPTISELLSLKDYCPDRRDWALPCGHPFIDAIASYWSATTWFFDSNKAIAWSPGYGFSGSASKTLKLCRWCVRGGVGSSFVSD